MRGARRLHGAVLFAAALAASGGIYLAHAKSLALEIDDLETAGFSARGVTANLTGSDLRALDLRIARLSVGGREWRKVSLTCAAFEAGSSRVACPAGVLHVDQNLPVSFSYVPRTRAATLEVKLSTDEVVRASGTLAGADTAVELSAKSLRLDRLAAWLPAGTPKLGAGRASGTAQIRSGTVEARIAVEGLQFADASGLHAGEKIAAGIEATAAQTGDEWRWKAALTWRAGEVFWQPVFMSGKGQRLDAEGTTSARATEVRTARLELPGVGSFAAKGRWNRAKGAVETFEASAAGLQAAGLYADLLKPMLAGTALADLRAEGRASFTIRGDADALSALDLDFDSVSFDDRQRRFALFGLNGRIPWRRDQPTAGEISIKGGELLKIPVGAARVPMRLRGLRVDVASVRIPVLDGAVTLRDFAIGIARSGWRWRFSGEIAAISMDQLTTALGLPVMHGSIAGVIPEVRYRRQDVEMDGELAIRAFDGTVAAERVRLIDAFGPAPRLHAELDVRNLDLELLTRTFDFGTITGRIDARVADLELVAWQPVRFNARIESSPGSYPKRISQRAVQNISALGGAGAAVAIQRSLLRFFDTFGYERLGVSCRLQNSVCTMDGIEPAPQGYVIVKGGGIPAISVIGYNRAVNWRELTERLKRITQDNVKPVIK